MGKDAALEASQYLARITWLPLVCGIVVIAGSVGPWVAAQAVFSHRGVHYPGFVYHEGQVTLLAGAAAVALARWQRLQRARPFLATVGSAIAFGAPALLAIATWWDSTNLRVLPGGGVPVEGWAKFEVAWGLKLVVTAGLVGFAVTLFRWIWRDTLPGSEDPT